jgi:hypothetical protein
MPLRTTCGCLMRDNAAMPNATELKFGDPGSRIA